MTDLEKRIHEHARVNMLLARQNADLREVLSDLHEAGVIPDALRSRATELLDLYAKPHAWYREYREQVEAWHAVGHRPPLSACGSEVARAAE